MKKYVNIAYVSVITLILFFFSTENLFAQDGWGTSVEADISKKIIKNLEASLSFEWRQRDGVKDIDRLSTAIDINYRLCKYVKIGGAYNMINYDHIKKGWEVRNRYYFYATGNYKIDRFKFTLRERAQSTYRVGVKSTSKRANPKWIIRSKIGAEYNIRKSPFEPYASVEFFNTINDPRINYLEKVRYEAGCAYKLNKKNSFSLSYRYTDYADEDDTDVRNMICVGYSFKF